MPVSRYGESFDFHFNAGITYVPNASTILGNELHSPGRDLTSYNLGVAAYWKPEVYLHFFVELLALRIEQLDDAGARNRTNQVFVNPGLRYAVCQFDEVEWVIGAAAPIGLTRATPDIGVFLYMSVEHSFRKQEGENGK